MKIKKTQLQIAFNHLWNIGFDDFRKMYKRCTNDPYLFLVNGTTLRSNDPL